MPRRARSRRRVLAASASAGLVLGLSGPATAGSAPPGTSRPIGGDLLGSPALVLPAGAPKLPAGLTAPAWLVADAATGHVLAARNPHGRFAPASTLKILTAVTLLPRLNPRQTIVVTNADETVDGTRVGLVPGMRVNVHQLFTALLVSSANDAAVLLGRAAGGPAVTLRAMATEARRMQALDTVPRTLHGLDAAGQASSAYDLALLGRAGLALPAFRRYVATRRAWMPAPGGKHFQITNHNRLLASYPGTIGIKNGHTDAARSSLVVAARRGGRTVLVSLMRVDTGVWQQARLLLDWAFAAAGRVSPVGTLVPPVPPAQARTGPPAAAARVAPAALRAEPTTTLPARQLALGGTVLLVLLAGGLLVRRRPR